MSTKIDEYKSLLTHITIAQNVQFHRDATRQIDAPASQVNGIFPAFETYRSDADALDAEFDRKSKSIETDELALKDGRRDATTVQIISRIDYHSRFPQNDTEKEAARILQFIADAYREAPRKSYQAETSYLRNMIAELHKNEAGLELFGLTSLVDRLDRENTEFETLHATRANVKEARRESGTLGKFSEKANKSFDVLCQIANGMLLMPLDDVTKSALKQIASLLNAQINQYGVNYRHHAGVVAGKKKANEKNMEE
ncbi:MAG: DUF6261 family protein [Dysgonamonadaceae bacterium]|jgi:hypothetical protein|nr:DUF6261 family protein [Dysgonamonadaceae bacterium]